MATQRPTFLVKSLDYPIRNESVSGLGIRVTYQDRECDLSIQISPPLLGSTPEKQAALDELRRLRDALSDILASQSP